MSVDVKITTTGPSPGDVLMDVPGLQQQVFTAHEDEIRQAIVREWSGFEDPSGRSLRGWQIQVHGDTIRVTTEVPYAPYVTRRGESIPVADQLFDSLASSAIPDTMKDLADTIARELE